MAEKKDIPKWKTFLENTITVILILLSISIILLFFALKDDNKGKYISHASYDLTTKVAISSVKNTEVTISENELNDFLALYFSNVYLSKSSNIIIENVFFELYNNSAKVYIPIIFNNIHFGLNAQTSINLNKQTNKIELAFSNIKIGRLPISQHFIENKLKTIIKDPVAIDKNVIYVPATFPIKIKGFYINSDIEKLEVTDTGVIFKTTGLLKNSSEFLIDKFKSLISYS